MKTRKDGVLKAVALLLALTAGLAMGCGSGSEDSGAEIDAKAAEILKGMSDHLAGAKSLTVRASRSIDPRLIEGGKAMDQADVTVSMVRPNMVAAASVGAGQERRMFYDGETFALHAVQEKVYGQVPFSGDLDGLFDMLEKKLGIALPIAEFLRKDPYTALTGHAKSGKYVGEETVGGVVVHHLAFGEEGFDWDLWVGAADKLPHRMEIRVTALDGDPAIKVEFKGFELGTEHSTETFAFTPEGEVALVEMMSSESLETE